MAIILDGRVVQAKVQRALKVICERLKPRPQLVIVQVGQKPESAIYVEQKKKFGRRIGVNVIHLSYPSVTNASNLISRLQTFNNDPQTHGIIVQLPLPEHLIPSKILNAVRLSKDVDGLSAENLQLLWHNEGGRGNGAGGFNTATARGVLTLLSHHQIPLAGKRVVIVGRSPLVGKSLALACLNVGGTVTIAHRQTKNLGEITREADILISAAGAPGLITKRHVRSGQVVIDVGINTAIDLNERGIVKGDRRLVGDVEFDEVAPIVEAITPVPGGVGPLTVACLFENLLEAYHRSPR